MTYVHQSSPTRAKLSVHMQSRKPRPKKVDAEALPAIEQLVSSRGVSNIPQDWREELTTESEAPLESVLTFWKDLLAKDDSGVSPEVAQEILASIATLADKYPAASQREGSISEGAVVLTDPKTLKAQLHASSLPKPVVEWGDLPIAKF